MTSAFHATWPTRKEAIDAEGIEPGADGVVYLANKVHYAAGFMRLRAVEYVGSKTIVLDGVHHTVPDIVQHEEIVIVEVDLDLLDPSLVGEGDDHSMASGMFPEDLEVIVYEGPIPTDAIVGWYSQPMSVPAGAE